MIRLVLCLALFVPLLALFGAASVRQPGFELIGVGVGVGVGGGFGVLFAFAAAGRIGPDSAVANFLFGPRQDDELERSDEDG